MEKRIAMYFKLYVMVLVEVTKVAISMIANYS